MAAGDHLNNFIISELCKNDEENVNEVPWGHLCSYVGPRNKIYRPIKDWLEIHNFGET